MEILFDAPEIKKKYLRWQNHFGDEDPYKTDDTIGMNEVLKAHFLIGDFFYQKGEGISDFGPRDPNLLHSAVYRQFTSYMGRDKWKNSYEKCATLIFGIVKDHPFHDANKRTSLLILLYFLAKQNKHLTIRQKQMEKFVIDIAKDKLRSKRKKRFMDENTDDPEIYYIADFIRKYSRARRHNYHTITYQELDKRLGDFNYCLHNPHKNFIDVCRIEEKKKFLFFGGCQKQLTKVAQVGFPGWKKQVGKGAITTIRKETKLTIENGVDSESFFRGADPLYSLISEYQGPLERLANK